MGFKDNQGQKAEGAQAWKQWQVSTSTEGNVEQSRSQGKSHNIVFHKQTSILPLNSTSSSAFNCKSGAAVLLSPTLCCVSFDREVFRVLYVLWQLAQLEPPVRPRLLALLACKLLAFTLLVLLLLLLIIVAT